MIQIPLIASLKTYDKSTLSSDALAGLTTGVMLVPQAMAYAMLAGLPPIVGLYASTIPLVLYALFGTSRQLAVGPVAMVSLLVAAGVAAAVPEGAEVTTIVALAGLLALMVGVFQTGMGVFRLGFLVNFLSHPVVSGFTSAAALIIGFSQLKHLLGVPIPRSHHVHEILLNAIGQLANIKPETVVIGALAIAFLLLAKRFAKRLPSALIVVVATTLAVYLLKLDTATVGVVPAGLPALSIPSFDLESMRALLPTAIAISLVGFMESISVAKAFARKHKTELDANQELIGLGVANLGSAFVGGYPVTGGFSRTAVNDQAGAKSGVAALITALVVALTLLFLTPLFVHLPKATLAAIIMVAVFGLIDIAEMKHLWTVSKRDLGLLVLTFFSTLLFGIEMGIGVGVASSLFIFLFKTTRPHFAVLGRIPGTEIYKNRDRHDVELTEDVLALRFDAQFYFGNVTFLREQILMNINDKTRRVVLDMNGVNQLDASADAALHELHEELEERGIALSVASVKGPVLDVMKRSEFTRKVTIFLRVHDAMSDDGDSKHDNEVKRNAA